MDLQLLYAKEAIFKLIVQFHHPTKLFEDSDELYIYNYCESALERAFDVLEIEEDYITLADFCQMLENNNRAIWEINIPGQTYNGITADMLYKHLVEKYESWLKSWDELD